MTKILSMAEHLEKKKDRERKKAYWHSLWFAHINNGIKDLAYKDKNRILKSIDRNYFTDYIKAMGTYNSQGDASIKNYILDSLNISKPFSIDHAVEFTSDHLDCCISDSDCENIADIIVRVSLCYTLDLFSEDMEPINLARQYKWEHILIEENL
ncbi:hypothetical protein [Alkaliphilus serpentinus]|uniref:Uncharacterized protein n=1 Tax=Alkaliphilus serpentinus TaxID=1482731 RepID=A0A833HPH4_9FIRM|nr:hypothetical protein [Alkaliphilus serpentinus]KAB3530723.1 hypothetical protein F8153_06335 [Alkaliphilus serpentinus]